MEIANTKIIKYHNMTFTIQSVLLDLIVKLLCVGDTELEFLFCFVKGDYLFKNIHSVFLESYATDLY